MGGDEERDGVSLTNLDQPLFEGAAATKRDLVDYLDVLRDRIIPELRDRPLSVVRVLRGQAPFMQKNVPKYTPPWVRTVPLWAEASRREVSYALCNDRRTLLWFANQRAVEYHPTLIRTERRGLPIPLVLDLDPPPEGSFPLAVRAAHLVRQALADAGLVGAVKTSGAKGVHVFVPDRGVGGDRRRGRCHPRDRCACRAPRPRARHHGLHPGRPRRQGVPRFDQSRRRDGGGGVQPAGPGGCTGVVPGGMGGA